MKKPSPPAVPVSAKVSRMRCARSHLAERTARLSYIAMQKRYDAGEQPSAAAIGFVTMTLWAAEAVHKADKARYQETLERRKALPVERQWPIKDLEDWVRGAMETAPLPAPRGTR